jgi:DNA-binding transcriptional LysR family regulator
MWLFDHELASGEVQQLLPDWPLPAMPIHVVSPREHRHSAKVKVREQASTAERHRNHNESREDQRRGEMLERLPIS